MKLGWQYKDDELQVFTGVDDVPPVFRCNIMKSIDLADLARACGYDLVKRPVGKSIDENLRDMQKAVRSWSTAAINMGMPEEDFPTGQWPFVPPQNNADLEEHIARSPEKDAAEYRIAVKKAIFRGPL